MIKELTYTREMQEQDDLWREAKEDPNVMEKLYNKIAEEAKSKGFKGVVVICGIKEKKWAEVFESEEQIGKVEVNAIGYCKPLIQYLEEILNN